MTGRSGADIGRTGDGARRGARFALGGLALAALAACGTSTFPSAPAPATFFATQTPTEAPAATEPAATAAPTQGAATTDPFAFAAQFEGTYSGTWTNTTFGSTGPASIELAIDRGAGALDFPITLGGNVFGSAAPEPEVLRAAIVPGQPLEFDSATFGETSVEVDLSSGSPVLTIHSPDVPSDRIRTFTATATIEDPDAIDFAYEVQFRGGGSAAGTAPLSRE